MKISPNGRLSLAASTVLLATLSIIASGCSSKPAANSATTAPTAQSASPTASNPGATASAGAAPAGPSAPGNPGTSGTPGAPAPAPAVPQGITLPTGTRLQVRLNQTINVKHVHSGERFSGSLAEPIVQGSTVAVPAGAPAIGEILVAHKRGVFKGRSMMALTLTRLDVNGQQYRIDTSDLTRTKKGKGKRSAAFIGGGAGMGMLIGGVATGGVGLLVGGLAGGGAGALGAAFTGNRDLVLPAESVVTFRLQNELTLMPETHASLNTPQ